MIKFGIRRILKKLSSFMISVPDGSEIDYAEEPVYDISSLFADVGGAAGLALGMSLATLLGALEYSLCKLFDILSCWVRAKWFRLRTTFGKRKILCKTHFSDPNIVVVRETYF